MSVTSRLIPLILASAAWAAADLPERLPERLQSSVRGMLVVELPNGQMAGTATQMSATAVRGEGRGLEIGFNQDTGEEMRRATGEVEKFIAVRHRERVQDGLRIELSFADKYVPKDGPSAAVASALMVDAILSDRELDSTFAVTGDMNADGSVQPVGGVIAKIRGARLKGCTIVAIPGRNEESVSDSYIIDGIRELRSVQVFSIESFDQAHALAGAERDEDLAKAIATFDEIREVLARDEQFAFNARVQERLREVLQLAPNHLSAKYLLLHGARRGPQRLSLVGSLMAIDEADTAFAQMLDDGSFTETAGENDVLFRFEGELMRLKPLLDRRTVRYCDAYLALATYIKTIRSRRVFTGQMERELQTAVQRVRNERNAVISNPEIQEELMLE